MCVEGLEKMLPIILKFRRERDWAKFHRPKDLAAAISVESSELLELFLWREMEEAGEVREDDELMISIREEVADILIYLLYLSHDLNIDLREAVMDKVVKNAEKYPQDDYFGRFHGVAL